MDYAIIGGGPAGLCFALYAARAGYRCTLYEAEELGGCHSVHSHWREHGPRVYSRSYVNFAKVLHDVGTTWNNEFQDYAFQISQIGANSGATLSLREMAQLAWYLQYPEMPVAQALHDFTPASRDYIERLCRLVDGASAQRMPMRTLAGLVNQESVNALAQPRRSMNLLWARWARVLHKYGVRIVRRRITDISNVQARRIVLAMPPQAYCSIAGVPQPNAAWLQATSYNRYYSYTFAWHERVLTQQQRTAWGFAATRNGLVYIILSDYLQDVRGELISVALTRPTTRPD